METRYQKTETIITLNNLVRIDGETEVEGAKTSTLKDLRGRISFIPAGRGVSAWSRLETRMSEFVAVYLETIPADQETFDFTQAEPRLHFLSRRIETTLIKIKDVLLDRSLRSNAYLETLGLVLRHELSPTLEQFRDQSQQTGLSQSQLSLIRDYVNDRISEDITVSDLAVLVSLSRFHFIRAFGAATGVSPYQYILKQRVTIAMDLLQHSGSRVEDISLAVGFKAPLQLNRAFRRATGLSPSQFRKMARG